MREKGDLSIRDLIQGAISPQELQYLLLVIHSNIVKKELTVKRVFKQFKSNRFVQPPIIGQRELLKFDLLALGIAPAEFEAIELSPVNPLGVNGILTKIDQKNVLSTVRNTEVCGDITTVLALECAKRREKLLQNNPKNDEEINLCTSQRSVRLQKLPEGLGFTPHFRAFAACTATRDTGDDKFESQSIKKHVSFYLNLIGALNQRNYSASDITVFFSDVSIAEKIISTCGVDRKELMKNTQTKGFKPFEKCKIVLPEFTLSLEEAKIELVENLELNGAMRSLREIERKVVKELKAQYPEIAFGFDLRRIAGIGHYDNICFKITASNKEGKIFPLADGGSTDWTKKILFSQKERLFISAFGSELFCKNFKK